MLRTGKWVCTKTFRVCKGTIYLHGEVVDCPLMPYCAADEILGRRWEFEFPCHKKSGSILELTDPDHGKEHLRRFCALRKVFATPEQQQRIREQRDRYNEYRRAKRHAQREAAPPKVSEMKARETLPCGEDCENCPYDECRYPDYDIEEVLRERQKSEKKERRRQYDREYRVEHKKELSRKNAERWAAMTDAERAALNAYRRQKYAERVAAMTDAERAALKKERSRLYMERLTAMTDEERGEWYANRRRQYKEYLASMPEEKHEALKARKRKYQAARRKMMMQEEEIINANR